MSCLEEVARKGTAETVELQFWVVGLRERLLGCGVRNNRRNSCRQSYGRDVPQKGRIKKSLFCKGGHVVVHWASRVSEDLNANYKIEIHHQSIC